jgi:hypothetical protein
MKFLLLLFLSSIASAEICTFLPENDLSIPVTRKSEGLSEEAYHRVIDKFEKIYQPVLKKKKMKLVVNRLWENPRVNAGTLRKGAEVVINLYGGYPRHPFVTEDGYALVLCHELGHHIGGAPKKTRFKWPATEGQADYFATLKCLRKIFADEDNEAIVSRLSVPEPAEKECSLSFPSREKYTCLRSVMAGLSAGAVSSVIRHRPIPTLETPDLEKVDKTFEQHPYPQCRLDTYFQGAICEVNSDFISMLWEEKGTCHERNGHVRGLRPTCWHRPRE